MNINAATVLSVALRTVQCACAETGNFCHHKCAVNGMPRTHSWRWAAVKLLLVVAWGAAPAVSWVPSLLPSRMRVGLGLHTRRCILQRARTRSVPKNLQARGCSAVMGKTGREQKSREVIKDPIHERTRVVIVGGGIGGLAAAS